MISYSHDSPAHMDWVRTLAERLTQDGVEVLLDQWHLQLGDELPRFMEASIAKADYILLICTEPYVRKADERAGGVGYESSLLSAQLLAARQIAEQDASRIIPILRQSTPTPRVPRFMAGRYYANLSENVPHFEAEYEQLVRTLHRAPKHQPPARGTNPFATRGTAPAEPGMYAASSDASNSSSARDLQRHMGTMRHTGAKVLVARHSFLPPGYISPGRPSDELTSVIRTHEPYLRELVQSTLKGPLSARLLAHEIEDVMSIPGWPQNGPASLVQLPRALGWAAHRLIGAALLLKGRAGLAVALARQSILLGDQERKLIRAPELIGWPIGFGHSREAWETTRHWSNSFPWLNELFGPEEYWVAMNAHVITLNFAEFLERAAHGPSFHQIRRDRQHTPNVPLHFWEEPAEVGRRAFRLVAEDARPGLRDRIGTAIHLSLGDLWERWMAYQRGWLEIESNAAASARPPHQGLLAAVLQVGG
jgi:hypothetical protein